MKIRTRLFLGFLSIAIITLVIGIFTYFTYSNVVKISEYHTDVGLPATRTISEIKAKFLESGYIGIKYLDGDYSAKKEYNRTKSEFFSLLTTYQLIQNSKSQNKNTFLANAETNGSIQNLIINVEYSASKFFSTMDEMVVMHELGHDISEMKKDLNEIEEYKVIFLDTANKAYQMEFDQFLKKQNELEKINRDYLTTNTFFVGFLITSIFGIGFFISNSISKPILLLNNGIKKTVIEGLQEPLPLKGDEEIQRLTQSFNELENSLKKLDIMKDKEFSSVKNITDLKHALDTSSNVTITDNEGTITYVNDKFCKISKYSEAELIGQNHRLLKSGYHPPSFYKKMWEDISNGFVWKGDVKNKAKDGSFYWVRTTIVPILGKNEKPHQYIALRYDITHQKDVEEKLNQALVQLKRNDKLKDEFASMITHELKTPLTPIRGYCEMLKMPNLMGTLNHEQLQSIKEIEGNAKRLEVLIGDVLDAQKLDMNQMSFKKSNINTDEFMDTIFKNSSHLMKEKNINFINNTEKYSIITDKDRLTQVMNNLITNSVDFVPKEHGKIEIGTKKDDFKIIFYVRDNGIGIPKDKQDELFKKFYQVDTTATRHHGGTGLGLTICKGIVEGLGGEIWVESEIGKGATFYFSVLERNSK